MTHAMTGAKTTTLVVFDVNETLSDMSSLQRRFEEVGLPGHAVATWFASLLRDGFALTAVGTNPTFADLAAESLRVRLAESVSGEALAESVALVMGGISELAVHDDVPDGVAALRAHGLRLVTLSNGGTGVAEALFNRAGIRAHFERLLSVEDGAAWKPDARAYQHALTTCGTPPEESLLVAVHPWDIDGAHRAGLRAAWVNRTGARYPSYFSRPDLEASSLVDLARQLSSPGSGWAVCS